MSLKSKIEAVIYASEDPVTLAQFATLFGHEAQAELDAADARQPELPLDTEAPPAPETPDTSPATEPTLAELRVRDRRLRDHLNTILDQLIADYRDNDRGLEIREIAGGFRFATKPEFHDAVRGFVRSLKPPLKLSLQALETLAVVAYKQPITAPEVSEIRGVDSAGVLGSLIGRKLVATAGRKQVIGRPILYKTTKDFLLRFGLKDLAELPSIEEFERLAADINEAVQEEIPLPDIRLTTAAGPAPGDLEPSRDTHIAQADGDPGTTDTAPAPDAPGEFTGDETVPPADNVELDGRISGVPPTYDAPNADIDSPAQDAEIQAETPTESPDR